MAQDRLELDALKHGEETQLNAGGGPKAIPYSSAWWEAVGISVGCTLFAGLMSGLTIGLLSID
jgi:hypothetical protein